MRKQPKIDKKEVQLDPPDRQRCQAEKPDEWNFMTLGGRKEMIRCFNNPTVIVREKKPGKDGQCGSMSLCTHCLLKFMTQMPPFASQENYEFEEIK